MNETYVTVVGNVATVPVARRTGEDGTVLNFRVASTERRYDPRTGSWIDGASLFVSVSCWRQLAQNVLASLSVGDPIIVWGKLQTQDYEKDGRFRTDVKVDARAVGPNLDRSRAAVTRVRREAAETGPAVEGAEGAAAGSGFDARPAPGGDRAPADEGRAVSGRARAAGADVEPSSDDQRELLSAPVEAGVGA